MELPLGLQSRQFLLAAALGIVFGVHYDLLRGLRRSIRHLTAVLDFWFALTFLIASLLFALYAGNGEYRIFMPVGTALGMTVYFLTLSRLFLPCSLQFWRILTCPLRCFGRFCRKNLEKLKKIAKNIFSSAKKSVTIKCRQKMPQNAGKKGQNDAPVQILTHYKAHHSGSHDLRDRDDRHPPTKNQRAQGGTHRVV